VALSNIQRQTELSIRVDKRKETKRMIERAMMSEKTWIISERH